MRSAIAVLLVVVLAALASANPTPAWPGVFIDFDEDGVPDVDIQNAIYPAPYQTLDAYVAVACNDVPGEEITSVSFALTDPMVWCPGVFAPPTFTNLMPGDLAIGNPYTGITLASTECLTDPMVYVAKLTLFYLGGQCEIQILDHPEYPRWVVDCNSNVHYYGIGSHGGVGMEPYAPWEGEMYCPAVPVEDVSWGAVKAMYR